jgi:large subunit ribosomal protein L20
MSRVKRGTLHHKRRANIIEYTKGFRWGRKSKLAAAKQAMMKALSYNYRDRKVKKRDNRALWNIHINGFCRKILSEFSVSRPELFQAILEKIK